MANLHRWTAVRLGLGALAVAAAFGTTPVQAQSKFPTYPIRIILPFGAGSVSDVTFRILSEKLGQRLGGSVVVENMPRAGGITAATTTMAANPDGHTLIILSGSTAISMSLLKSVPYNPMRDFVPIAGVSTFANIVAAGSGAKYTTFAAFEAAARAKPGSLNVGTTIVGSTNHLAATLLRSASGLKFEIVPFRTPADLVTSAVRGDVDAIVQSFGSLKSSLADKQLVAMATTTKARTAYAPDVPTLHELGVKEFDVMSWNGIFAPAKTPPEVLDLINREVRATLDDPELKQRFVDLGLEPMPTTRDQLGKLMQDEIEKWAGVIKDAGIQPQ